MQQHPVPQPITSYEFRLVGDMTLKQFLKLAAGVVLALIVYAINPPELIKWFFILLFTGSGAAMAFVPLEGRPLDTWVIAFFKRIYSPTLYVTQGKAPLPITPPTTVKNPPPVISPTETSAPTVKFTPPPPPTPKTPAVVFKAGQTSPPPKVEAKFAQNLIIPATPAVPNILVGFVHDKDGKIIEGAILEIRDTAGNPVRAFKTNKLGQFRSATPLPPGEYEIETEKEGYRFDIIKIKLEGKILAPIEIIGK